MLFLFMFFFFGYLFSFTAYFKRESEGLGEGVDDLWTSNISGPDFKPGHPIYTVHFEPQPTDANCFINIKWWESNDMSALYCELFSVVAS